MANLQHGLHPGPRQHVQQQHGASHFVHDFAGIDRPLGSVVDAIDVIATPSLLAELVAIAWRDEMRVIDAMSRRRACDELPCVDLPCVDLPCVDLPCVDVVFGSRRTRHDAVIMPVAWRSVSTHWVPPIDADLEFAAFGTERTHIHLYGSSELPPHTPPASEPASVAQQLTVAIVRHVLDLLTQRIVDVAPDH